jgi:hypothetical protein
VRLTVLPIMELDRKKKGYERGKTKITR